MGHGDEEQCGDEVMVVALDEAPPDEVPGGTMSGTEGTGELVRVWHGRGRWEEVAVRPGESRLRAGMRALETHLEQSEQMPGRGWYVIQL